MAIPRRCMTFVLVVTALFAGLQFAMQARAATAKCDHLADHGRFATGAVPKGASGLEGWGGAFHCDTSSRFGIEGSALRYWISGAPTIPRSTVVMAGPRWTLKAGSASFNVHGMGGGGNVLDLAGPVAMHSGLAYAVGGGMEVPLGSYVVWRVAGNYQNASGRSQGSRMHTNVDTGLLFRF